MTLDTRLASVPVFISCRKLLDCENSSCSLTWIAPHILKQPRIYITEQVHFHLDEKNGLKYLRVRVGIIIIDIYTSRNFSFYQSTLHE